MLAVVRGGLVLAFCEPQAGTTAQVGASGTSSQAAGHPQQQQTTPIDGRRGLAPTPYPGPGSPGQGPGGEPKPWWKDPAMVKEVGLTADQVTKIDKIYERRNKLIATQLEEYNKQHDELDRMLRERVATPEAVELQAQRMMPFYVAITVSRIKMLYEMSRVMTAEQNDRLQAMRHRMGPERGRGPGNLPRH